MNILDLVLQDIMRVKGECLDFVQLGAHDGLHLDPVRPYIDRHHWRGVLVEPQPRIFQKLMENYQHEPQLQFENYAICPHDGFAEMNVFDDENQAEHSTMLASFFPRAITNNTHGYGTKAKKLVVRCMTLETLFEEHEITTLDFLQIDCEGFDFEIIKMLEKTKVRPTAINFEHAFYGPDQLRECLALIASMGYSIASYGIDTVCYLQPENAPRAQYGDQKMLVNSTG